MQYKTLAELYEKISSTTKRLEKIDTISKFLQILKDRDALYLLLGDIYPNYDERKIGISNQLAIKAISKSTGVSEKEIIEEWKKVGDLGKVSEKFTKNKKQATLESHILTTEKILENLRKLPELEGKGTVDKKLALITELLTSASPIEAKYLIRTVIGDLRIGIQESTIRESMAVAFFENKKEVAERIQKAIDRSNDIAEVFDIAKKGKIKELEKVSLQVGKPIKAMLATKVSSIEEGFKEFGKPIIFEYKYDGLRMIIHKDNSGKIKLFTRRLENVTKQFPEVVEYILKYIKGKSFILDSEAVGFEKSSKEYRPFQEISQRIKRKYHIEELQKKLPVEINVFDIIYYNNKSLLNEPIEKRTKLLRKIITPKPYKIIPSKQLITSDVEEAKKFYKAALKDNQEGLMLKKIGAEYKPGRSVGHMAKIKPDERDLDLVITGAEYGTGKRSGWLSSFILSCRAENEKEVNNKKEIKNSRVLINKRGEAEPKRDSIRVGGQTSGVANNQQFLEVGKMSTGIKELEEQGISYKEMTKLLTPLIIKETGRQVQIKPKIVIAVTYQEIQRSPNYNSEFALRFPRFTALRHDKPLSEVATLEEIKKDYEKQSNSWKYG